VKILCATDLLRKTEPALERAGMLAEALDADLSLLHVVPPTESERMLKQDLQHARGLWRYTRSPRDRGRARIRGPRLSASLRRNHDVCRNSGK